MTGAPSTPDPFDFDGLVAAVVREAASDAALDRLRAAARTRDQLAQVADSLLDHFVEAARDAQCSWSQVGDALGVSRQAAQQAHASDKSVLRRLIGRLPTAAPSSPRSRLFDRFSPRASAVITTAREQAEVLGHPAIGTEHLLLGLATLDGGVVHDVLTSLDVTIEACTQQLERIAGECDGTSTERLRLSPRSKKLLELALRETLRLKAQKIEAEHVLLGLLREGEGLGAQILVELGVDLGAARDAVLDGLR